MNMFYILHILLLPPNHLLLLLQSKRINVTISSTRHLAAGLLICLLIVIYSTQLHQLASNYAMMDRW